jgi:hypothetical protein
MSEETKPIVVETSAVEKRLWRLMLIALLVEIVVCLILKDWQFVGGVIIGGSLAIINFRMLQSSVRGIFQTQSSSFAIKFFLRYAIIGLVVLLFYYLKTVSIIGILLGISSFVIALMIEAFIQFYFVMTKNEDI